MYQKINNFVVLLLGLVFLQVYSKSDTLYEGSNCQNADSFGSGICTLITDCPLALQRIQNQGFHNITRCGFLKYTEIVCCPSDSRRPKPSTPDDDEIAEISGIELERKSEKACKKYSKDFPNFLAFHIIEGENAYEGEFPHMAALGFYQIKDKRYGFNCGGTLISADYIITAAHCLINVQNNELKIARLGVVNVPESIENPDPNVDHSVINITVHQDYNGKEKLNDIALVKLKKKVSFTNYIQPACLYTKDDNPKRLMVTGWGVVGLGGRRGNFLQKATLTAVGLQECNTTYQTITSRYLTKNQLCAADYVSDTCQGNSGEPLQTQSNTRISTIVGVTSYGIGCGRKYPGVYTKISRYLDWIEGTVWPVDV